MALNGVFSTSISSGHYRLKAVWKAVQNIANNTSAITVNLYMESDYSLYVGERNGTITIDGTSYSYKAPKISQGSAFSILIGTATKTIAHGNDGSKSFTMSAYYPIAATISGTYYGSMTASSGTVALDTIPRTSQPSLSSNSFDMGTTVTISTNRASSAFTHTIKYSFGNASGTIATGVTDSATWGFPLATLAPQIPNATSGTGSIICETYNGGTLIGTKSVQFTAKVPENVVPTVASITGAELNTNVTNLVGAKYVQNLSNIRLTVNGAVGAYGSTIASYKINYNGQDYIGSATKDTGIIAWKGNKTVTATVMDSRGRTTSTTLTLSALAYSPPLINTFTVERCNQSGDVDQLGTNVKIVRVGTASSLLNGTEKNTITAKVYKKLRKDTAWTEITSATVAVSSNVSGAVGSTPIIVSGFPIENAYDFKLELTDKFYTSISTSVVAVGTVLLSLGVDGVGIGKVLEQGTLDVQGDAFISGTVYEGGTSLVKKYAPIHSHPYVPTSTYTAGDILTKLKTVDGANSGLDADMVDGYHSGSFLITTGGDTTSSWTKFPDGTLITKQLVSLGTVAITSAWGSMYTSGSKVMPDYPVAFIDTPAVFINISNTTNNSVWIGTCGTGTASTPPKVELFRATTASPTWVYIHITAVGRWK